MLETGGRLRAAPVIDGAGVVYSASADGKLYRVQDGAGRVLFDSGARLRATPALAADGTIYLGSEAGTLFALAPDGSVRWQRTLAAPILADLTRTPDGLLLVAADGVYAFDASGALLWHYLLPELVRSSPCVHPAGFVVFGTAQGAVVALELDGPRALAQQRPRRDRRSSRNCGRRHDRDRQPTRRSARLAPGRHAAFRLRDRRRSARDGRNRRIRLDPDRQRRRRAVCARPGRTAALAREHVGRDPRVGAHRRGRPHRDRQPRRRAARFHRRRRAAPRL